MDDKPFVDYEFIKSFYEIGFTDGYNYVEASYIAKYFYWILEYGKARTKTALKEYCEEHDKNFNFVIMRGDIIKIVNRTMKKNLNNYKTVTATQKELSIIETVKNYRDQKMLFSILIFSKRAKFDDSQVDKKQDYIGYRIHSEVVLKIFNKLGYNISSKNIATYISKFEKINLLDPIEGNTFLKVLFSNDESKPVIEVLGTENPWDKFNFYNGGEYVYCNNCQKKVLKISNNHKYCDECKKIKRLENVKSAVEKYRNK